MLFLYLFSAVVLVILGWAYASDVLLTKLWPEDDLTEVVEHKW